MMTHDEDSDDPEDDEDSDDSEDDEEPEDADDEIGLCEVKIAETSTSE